MDISIASIPNHRDYRRLFGPIWSESSFWNYNTMEEILEHFEQLEREAHAHWDEALEWVRKSASEYKRSKEKNDTESAIQHQLIFARLWEVKEEAGKAMVKSIFRRGAMERIVAKEYEKAHRITMGYYAEHDPIEQVA